METKFAIDQKDGDYSDEKYFRRLIRSIEVSQKYFLFFVACNQIPRQNELIADIKAELPTKNIEVINFKEPITDLLFELETISGDKSPDAIFVQGLGSSISSDGTGDANNLIYALNISRDSFNDAFQCPIYLWLPEYAVIKITRHAPDFFSVRSGVFYFSSTAKQVISDIFQSTSSEWLETSSLPVAEKQKRIVMLESLLAEYQGLQEVKRDRKVEIRLKKQLGTLFYSTSNYRKAIEYFEKALKIAQEIGDRQSEENNLGNLGSAYRNLGEYQKVFSFYEQALIISKEIGDRQNEARHTKNLGNAYNGLGDYYKAIEYCDQSLIISKETEHRQGECSNLGSLGAAYSGLGDYHKAIEYYEQALIISKEIGYRQGEGNQLGNLGNAYRNLGEYRKAIEYFEQSLIIFREIGDKLGEGIYLGNLGVTYGNLGDLNTAKTYYSQAIPLLDSIESPHAETFRQNLVELETHFSH